MGSLDERTLRNAKEEYSPLVEKTVQQEKAGVKKAAQMRAIAETSITEQIIQVDTARIKLKWALPVTIH